MLEGLYWFKLGMDKFKDITEGCQTHRNRTRLRKSWNPGKGLWGSLIHACSALLLLPKHLPWATGTGQLDKHPSDLTWAALLAPWQGPVSPGGYVGSPGIQPQGCWWSVSCSSPTCHPSDGHT